ncbi:AAA family ATPase [Ornithinibacillus bavariensis]|uniref:Topology modulation protein n=1 Tax=Ornithinibacillus bavariensis TaxID=545502 RepID=A0A919X7M7_9BACI|nr:AAA family ATPase [Ornithinibacillus bavariensis]GIO25623.1 topology modulation protein [Ornithinibacillus bavariensis]
MKKITILGNPGAGKSTLAKKLGNMLNIPVYHMDTFYWKPGWVARDEQELLQLHDEVLTQERWIIDGNYSVTLSKRLEEADTVIFLHYSTIKCLYGITKRRIQYRKKARPDIGKDCPERLNVDFILWTKNFNKNKAVKIYEKLARIPHAEVHIFRNRKQLKNFLKELEQNLAN